MRSGASDEVLMLAYRDGDAAAFEALYARFRGPMYRYLLRQCGNKAIAEELFQDVWMRVIRARERYTVKASFSTYVYQIAHNLLIDHYRKTAGKLPLSYDEDPEANEAILVDDGQPAVEVKVDCNRQVNELLVAIGELPDAQREAFLLKEESGMSLDEIAEVTGVNRETAKSRLRYAIRRLRQQLVDKN